MGAVGKMKATLEPLLLLARRRGLVSGATHPPPFDVAQGRPGPLLGKEDCCDRLRPDRRRSRGAVYGGAAGVGYRFALW
jgi:hypothetical protein